MNYQVSDRIQTKFGWGTVKIVVEGNGYAVLLDRHKDQGHEATTAIYYKDVIDEEVSSG